MDFKFTFSPGACLTCDGICCNGEKGFIWVNKDEIKSIAAFLGIDDGDFINNYLRKQGYKHSIKELKTGDNYACLFFDRKKTGCTIYDVRPEQCRTYPFWPFFKTNPKVVLDECPGVILKEKSVEKNEA